MRVVYYLLGAAVQVSLAREYQDGEKVPLYVNKVGPYENPHETYHYYQLPMCRPDSVVHKSLSLAEVLNGDRMAESLYSIDFKVNSKKNNLCGELELTPAMIQQLVEAIEEDYFFEFVIDDIRTHSFIGRLEEEGVFPHTHRVYLYVDHRIMLTYNGKHIISARVTAGNDPPIQLPENPTESIKVTFTYTVQFDETTVTFENRASQLEESFFPRSTKVHWLAVINSMFLVFLLVGVLVAILVRVVRSDFTRYNEPLSDLDKEDHLDNGWKVIHTDVFRFPPYPNLFCAILGVGSQLICIIIIILVISSLSLINAHRHGILNAAIVVLYALTSCVAGYVSAGWYRKMNGQNWVLNINITSCLFSVPLFITWAVSNSFFWGYTSTQALPVGTVVLLFAVWIFVGYPLCVVGGVLGRNYGARYDAPCRTRTIPREVPELQFYYSLPTFCMFGGFLPFSSISVELYYIFATIWGHESYTLYGIMLIVFIILLVVVASVSIGLTYFQLTAENYHWWWRSLFVGGSTGLFIFGYAIFFYFNRSHMSGIVQTVQYFGYVTMICYAFALLLGTVAFIASNRFVRYIYANVKTD